jgi:hypothetical protein
VGQAATAAPGSASFDVEAWAREVCPAGESSETVALFAELAADIAAGPLPERVPKRVPWRVSDWRDYFAERAALREHDGGLAHAEAEWRAYLDCVRLFLARHKPLALGGLCMRCAQPVGTQPRSFVEAEAGARGVVHADCADRFSLGRTRNAMAALERLGVGDPKAATTAPP